MPVAKHTLKHGGVAFAVIPNAAIEAIGDADGLAVLTYLLAKPTDWTIRKADIKAQLSLGEVRYRNAMRRLRDLGYVWDNYHRNDAGRIVNTEIWVGATPKCKEPDISVPKCKETDKSENQQSGFSTPLQKKELLQKKNNTGRFTPPTVEDVSLYCQERGNSIDPQTFVDHYEANGWYRGKTKIKDWKACVRTWERSRKPDTEPDTVGGYY